jgi:GTP-binding protein EngB required for normal cell division
MKPSLLIIGNSNVGKSSITRLLMPNPRKFKGKTGKTPGSTLLINPITHPQLPYDIIDLPGFGYMRTSSRRRTEHVKKQLVVHVEKNHKSYFYGLVILNILRIEDEIRKYHLENLKTIPFTYELINFLKEYNIPILIILNKTDKISNIDKSRIISLFIKTAKEYDINLAPFVDMNSTEQDKYIPYLEFSALKKLNLDKLKQIINYKLKN